MKKIRLDRKYFRRDDFSQREFEYFSPKFVEEVLNRDGIRYLFNPNLYEMEISPDCNTKGGQVDIGGRRHKSDNLGTLIESIAEGLIIDKPIWIVKRFEDLRKGRFAGFGDDYSPESFRQDPNGSACFLGHLV